MKIIAVSGVARSGKDTIANCLAEFAKMQNPSLKIMRASFASTLKQEMSEFLITNFDIDPFTADGKDKELIRPLLVAYGQARREQSNGQYWINQLEKRVHIEEPDLVILSDLRFAESDADELGWLKKQRNNALVHVSRYTVNDKGKKSFVKPVNSDEKRNDPKLKKGADYTISWPDARDEKELSKMSVGYCDEFYHKNISLFL
ncbi:hypothetical protein N9955_00905 [bacterium]|nr:hypothetical protein [bacterium]